MAVALLYYNATTYGILKMKILGLDLSLSSTGYCVLNKKLTQYGTIVPPKTIDTEIAKIAHIIGEIEEVIKKHNVTHICIEDTYYGMNFKTFKQLARLGGSCQHYFWIKHCYEVQFMMPTSARKWAGLGGRVPKCAVQIHVCDKYKLMDKDLIKYFTDQMNTVLENRKEGTLSKAKSNTLLIKLSKEIGKECGITTDIADAVLLAEAMKNKVLENET